MNIALLGISHWHASMHAEAAITCGAKIGACWDYDPLRANQFAQRFGGRAAPTVEEALADADLAVVMGHPAHVPDIAIRTLETGVPVILEKPAAPTTHEIIRVAATARERGNHVSVALPNRLGPAMVEYHRLAGERKSGAIAHAHFRIINGPPQRYRDDNVGWVLDTSAGGGGALRNLGIHGIDCALRLAQGALTPRSIEITKRIHTEEPVEDYALVTLQDTSGALFTVETGYTYASMAPGGDFEWRIASASAYLTDLGNAAKAAMLVPEHTYELAPLAPSQRYIAFMEDTLARLATGRAPLVGLDDYIAAMELIDRLYSEAQQ